ncbi:MAG TPA: hypothetical protein VMV40_08520, partial [Acidiferrobacter sp.]|nr:hypothetical protein [Acidiferrobacter sp.]
VLASGLMLATWAASADQGIVAYDNNLSLSFARRHVEYGERLAPPNGPYFDTESGFINGGRVAISGMGSDGINNLYLHLSYTQTTGKLNYVGGINGTTTSLVESTHAHMTDIGVRLGQGFAVAEHMMLVPYLAYGSHHWGRGQAAGVTNPHDYYESYRNNYLGLGVLWQMEPIHHFITTLNLAYGTTVHPTITAPAIGFAEGLGTKPWKRAGVTLDYLLGPSESVFASATYTQFQYGAGPVLASGYYEPFSQTGITDYNVGARFFF